MEFSEWRSEEVMFLLTLGVHSKCVICVSMLVISIYSELFQLYVCVCVWVLENDFKFAQSNCIVVDQDTQGFFFFTKSHR